MKPTFHHPKTRNTSGPWRALTAGMLSVTLGLTACGGIEGLATSAAETAVEKAIEADTGENVNLDFDGGSLSVETDEGSLQFDSETGEFVLVDGTGEVVSGNLDIDGNGISLESSEGSAVFNADTGEFEVTDATGDEVASGVVTEEGINATIEGEDGETAVIRSGVDIANDWPTDILAPYPGSSVTQAAEYGVDVGGGRILTLTSTDTSAEVFAFYETETEGWSGTRGTTDDGAFMVVTNETNAAQINIADTADGTEIVLVLAENVDESNG